MLNSITYISQIDQIGFILPMHKKRQNISNTLLNLVRDANNKKLPSYTIPPLTPVTFSRENFDVFFQYEICNLPIEYTTSKNTSASIIVDKTINLSDNQHLETSFFALEKYNQSYKVIDTLFFALNINKKSYKIVEKYLLNNPHQLAYHAFAIFRELINRLESVQNRQAKSEVLNEKDKNTLVQLKQGFVELEEFIQQNNIPYTTRDKKQNYYQNAKNRNVTFTEQVSKSPMSCELLHNKVHKLEIVRLINTFIEDYKALITHSE